MQPAGSTTNVRSPSTLSASRTAQATAAAGTSLVTEERLVVGERKLQPGPLQPLPFSDDEPFLGHNACAGCGGSWPCGWRLKGAGRTHIRWCCPPAALSAVGFSTRSWPLAATPSSRRSQGTASMMSGIAAAARALKLRDYHVVDSPATAAQPTLACRPCRAPSDRRENFIYICYDNEAYMNTGVQKSGLTPFGARTTTSPVGPHAAGARQPQEGHL